ncbi:DUF4339 domain-containing protein [Granulicella arctica]|uniref:GYF domain-containing protein n=1 Tax=Granulicella arctica TaxID=940613 RepID=A0A7Y9TJA3_9BACT|nr:DUF4339 domain-containing protein [Granulicella arctica]NYF78072.1 hypothetical protein [Granulicella arctica]
MTYTISRDGQEFGPYSLSDVQRYVGTGNILLTDLARAEGTTEWLPVAQVVGTIAVAPAAVPTAAYAAPTTQYPDPPNLHWALVLLIGIFTCGLFMIIWDLIQALWIKKVQPDTKALTYYLIFLGFWILNLVCSFGRIAFPMSYRLANHVAAPLAGLSLLVSLAVLVLMIVYRFVMRSSLERHFNTAEPVGLTLGPIMTFFFGDLYFQYHFNRINEIKRAAGLTRPY